MELCYSNLNRPREPCSTHLVVSHSDAKVSKGSSSLLMSLPSQSCCSPGFSGYFFLLSDGDQVNQKRWAETWESGFYGAPQMILMGRASWQGNQCCDLGHSVSSEGGSRWGSHPHTLPKCGSWRPHSGAQGGMISGIALRLCDGTLPLTEGMSLV